MKKGLSIALLFTAAVALTGCDGCSYLLDFINEMGSTLTLNEKNKTIEVGEKFQLEASSKSIFDTHEYFWYSSDETIATVSQTGLVTGVSDGAAKITVQDAKDDSVSAYCNFTVVNAIDTITVTSRKKNYRLNESFSTPTVVATYKDKTTKEVQNSCKFSGFDMSKEGNYTVNVSYEEDETTVITSYPIRVTNSAFPTISTLEITGQKLEFYQGEEFSFGGKATAKYSDGSSEDVTNFLTFSGYDMNTLGEQIVIVRYQENGLSVKTASYTIEVKKDDEKLKKTTLKYDYTDVTDNSVYSNQDSAPTKGNLKLLIIPVWFNDSTNYISDSKKASVRSDIEKAYLGTTSDTGWHSVASYYGEESHGKVSISGVVSNWYTPNQKSTYYYDSQDKTSALVRNATNWYFNQTDSLSRKSFDSDGDGYLDGVMLIYASPDAAVGSDIGVGDNMWAYCYWLSSTPSATNPETCAFFWASYDFMYGTNIVASKTGKTNRYANGDTSNCSLDAHTYIHEMGHIFGLDDYYDYCESTQYMPAGGLTMQDLNVGGHDPYSCMALGWAEPYIPTRTQTIEINPFQSSGDLILLTPNWNSYDSPFDEYILIEYYTPTGLNKFDAIHSYGSRGQLITQSGIRVWHVDARLAYLKGYESIFKDSQITTNPVVTNQYVVQACSNTYGGDHMSQLANTYSKYKWFNLLQLIRNNTSETYCPTELMDKDCLFYAGDSFNMSKFGNQFYNNAKLNTNINLGWTFKVNSIDVDKASITVTRG